MLITLLNRAIFAIESSKTTKMAANPPVPVDVGADAPPRLNRNVRPIENS